MRFAVIAWLLVACGAPAWRAVSAPPAAVYHYRTPIDRYAPDDAGLWIVTARDATPAARVGLARLLGDPADVHGAGFVVWLTNRRAAWWRDHPAVLGVVPLQPGDRLGLLGSDATAPARVDLADAATDAQRDAVIAWLAGRGVRAVAVGPRTLDAELSPAVARELAALGPVRWIERRGR